ncbi:laccase-6 [Cajanus cajan]|uniref:Laccase n=1 Tax=Cajanus cajan TaxID=3821 RepID=A0A151SIG9_CAJCA|nr:laccase-6 [Cajanus cajan]KYP54644.1 Laccase-6 [Cajanus cajan]
MANSITLFMLWLSVISTVHHVKLIAHGSTGGESTRFYDFKVQTKRVTKLCNSKDIVTINGMFPGPVVYAQEDDRIIVKVTNKTPFNVTIHWHGVRQRLSCWYDGASTITQCPIQSGQSFTYNFSVVQQKGTFFWHAHVSWLRGTVYGAMIVYPKTGVPYPFKFPYQEHIIILGEYWMKDLQKIEYDTLASGGPPPIADAYTINGHPGPNYNCSTNDFHQVDVIPGKTYLLRLINAGLNTENFFAIADHKLTIVEADAEYTKPFTTDTVMIGPGQTLNVLVSADKPVGKYSMAAAPYKSGRFVLYQNVSAIAFFNYIGAPSNSLYTPAKLPKLDDKLVVKTVMDGLRSLNQVNVFREIDENLFITIGLNVQKCHSKTPKQNCQAQDGVLAASMNNISFVNPNISILEAYYKKIKGIYTEDFPDMPPKFYDFVNGAPNNITYDTQSLNGTKTKVLKYGSKVQLILQDTGIVNPENHPMHFHGHSFYVVGYGTGNYNPLIAQFNLVDPPYMNTIGVPVGGWAAIRFVADNPGVWYMHCHIDIHKSWGLGVVFIVHNGKGELESLPHPPPDLPQC